MKNIVVLSLLLLSTLFFKATYAQSVQEMTTSSFKENIWNYDTNKEWKFAGNKPVIIDLYASWCGPCKQLAPILDEIQKDMGDKIQIYKVNTEKEREIAQIFNVSSIPLMIFIPKEGQPFAVNGLRPKQQLMQIINEHLGVK
ncbi:thioredoxin [Porphyromonadaceae bacterium OttesenSCG-928-L07]|nr:thioredoxin [Porphyromonadaceae bacterium OttesenSCG-928-L07]MDL2331166.1 thioredoxin [Odoribacter sp. OttesenSCG-928-A06]